MGDPAHGPVVQDLAREGPGQRLGKLVVPAQDPSFVGVLAEAPTVAAHHGQGRHLVRPGRGLGGLGVRVQGDDVLRGAFLQQQLDHRQVVELQDLGGQLLRVRDELQQALQVPGLLSEEPPSLGARVGELLLVLLERGHLEPLATHEDRVVEPGGHDLEAQLLAVSVIVLVGRVHVLGAHLRVEAIGKGIAIGEDPAPRARAGL